ncbi:Serine--glyoxylate aminotransferase [Musa troglodytarum]|uniref:Serine--glyoxylate aminotransferase n=1 Tax=Musa troglodytarum TaxID=320322 RepID=A0A9E7GRI7_9LILI|nr:Serine--glyoxylate aminotransferase [Musa troglodytarum]
MREWLAGCPLSPPPADESSSCGCPPSDDPNHSSILTQRRLYPSKDFSAAGSLLSATSGRSRLGTQLTPPRSVACVAPPPILCPPFIYKARLFLWPHLLLQIRRWPKGPVNIPEPVIRAMNRNNEDYRSPAVPALTRTLVEDVKKIFKTTSGTPFLIPTTGTGAWESALTNTLSPGDKIVSFLIGQFSLLWIDQQQRLKFNVDVIESEWGRGADLDALASKLAADWSHSIKAVCIVHNETATGVTNNLATVRKLLDEHNHPALLLVDGVSSICAIDFRMDEWGVDVALTGSQKALSMPTGMGIVCASPKALEAAKSAKSVRVFFDWNDYLKFYKMGTFWPYTPSIQLLYGLRAALDLLFEEGLDNVIARHSRLGKATRLAVEAWGLKNCTQKEEWFSDTVTAVIVPPHINSSDVVKRAWTRYNLSLGLGLNKVAGKVFRIGHLGNLNDLQLLGCLSGVEMVLRDVGYPVKLGSGVAAAAAYLQNTIPMISSRI